MSHPDPSQPIALVLEGVCADIVFNAPARRNAFNMQMWAALPGLIAEAEAVEAARVVVLHGGETGHFAAGADISEFETIYADSESAAHAATTIADGLNAIADCRKPVIAAIEGACVGGGVSLALACDIRIASREARFGVTPAKLGLVYPVDDTQRLVRAVGPSQAKDILFTGRIFDAERALRIGLVDDLAEPGKALASARARAEDIAAVSQYSVRGMKEIVNAIAAGVPPRPDEARQRFVDAATGPDFREGYRAFLEKRQTDFPNG